MKSLLEKYWVVSIFLLVAMGLVSPHIVEGFPAGHNTLVNVYWQQYFTEQLFSGELYPRWLFNYMNGFGAPIFYFYGPAPFYLLSLIEFIFGSDGEGLMTLTIGHMLLFFLSGFSFYIFVSDYVDRFWAIMFSVLYMLVPYHYIDLEVRAALGESLAYFWLPLIMTGVCRFKRTLLTLIFSSFCYGGLILSHLPSALLVSPVIVIYSICCKHKASVYSASWHAVFIGITGIALSFFYIMPALIMRDTLPYDAWVTAAGSSYQATNWLIGSPNVPNFGVRVYSALAITSFVAISTTLGFSFVCWRDKNSLARKEAQVCVIRSSLLSIALCWFLMSNVSSILWEEFSPLVAVQFPWRLGVVVDFCGVVLICLTLRPVLKVLVPSFFTGERKLLPVGRFLGVTFLAILAVIIVKLSFPLTIQSWFGENKLPMTQPEVGSELSGVNALIGIWSIEYRPRWLVESEVYVTAEDKESLTDIELASDIHEQGFNRWKSYVRYIQPIAPLRSFSSREFVVREENVGVNEITIRARVDKNATIRLKKLFYPHWQLVTDDGRSYETYPDKQTGLLLFDLSAGEHKLTLSRRLLPLEKAGFSVSLVTLLLSFCLLAVWGRKRV